MELRTLVQTSGAPQSSVAALPQVSSSARSVLAEIAASTATSDAQKQALIRAVATAETIVAPASRTAALTAISNLGVYLKNTGNEGFPRWTVLTALRSYGLNLEDSALASPIEQEIVQAQVQVQLAQVAQAANVPTPSVKVEAPAPAPVESDLGSDAPTHTVELVA